MSADGIPSQPSGRSPVSYLPPEVLEWIVDQRWYSGKGGASRWRPVGSFALDDPAGEAEIRVHMLLDDTASPLLYQVPITIRDRVLAGAEGAMIAAIDTYRGRHFVYDGPRDPAFASAILRLILDEGATAMDDGVGARGAAVPGLPRLSVVSSRVLSGEQSNTSVIFDVVDGDGTQAPPVICKLFRTLHDGDNPDVTLLGALTAAGSTSVPRSIGYASGVWPDSGRPDGIARGHLAFAQEFIPGVEDAWRVALRAADRGEDFTASARALGEATAEIHAILADALPSTSADQMSIEETISSMRRRFDSAAQEIPSVEDQRSAMERVYRRAADASWPPMQRIHGDYHLGQVLAVPSRGWIALDFEGEPLRPMEERAVVDSPLRDVAGMLRSFDYVAATVGADGDTDSAEAWSSRARRAFVDGYNARSGRDLRADRALLDAFEIDKALYEAVYEARNRPAWLPIPLRAIDRLIARSAASPDRTTAG